MKRFWQLPFVLFFIFMLFIVGCREEQAVTPTPEPTDTPVPQPTDTPAP